MDKKSFPAVLLGIMEPKHKTPEKNDAHPSRLAICVHLVDDKDVEKTMSEKRMPSPREALSLQIVSMS